MKIISAGIIFDLLSSNKVLICQRKKGSYYELKWEFPGGKVETGESIRESLVRELNEELNIIPEIGELYFTQKYKYPDGFEFEISFFLIKQYSGKIENLVFENIIWVDLKDLEKYDFLAADREVIDYLKNFNSKHQ